MDMCNAPAVSERPPMKKAAKKRRVIVHKEGRPPVELRVARRISANTKVNKGRGRKYVISPGRQNTDWKRFAEV